MSNQSQRESAATNAAANTNSSETQDGHHVIGQHSPPVTWTFEDVPIPPRHSERDSKTGRFKSGTVRCAVCGKPGVTKSALIKRINRVLAHENERMRKTTPKMRLRNCDLGNYHIVELDTNDVVEVCAEGNDYDMFALQPGEHVIVEEGECEPFVFCDSRCASQTAAAVEWRMLLKHSLHGSERKLRSDTPSTPSA